MDCLFLNVLALLIIDWRFFTSFFAVNLIVKTSRHFKVACAMSDTEVENWIEEAKSVINDIKGHVANVQICEGLESTDWKIFLNLTTLESKKYCIELSVNGFRVVGNSFDETLLDEENYFETPYSLLSAISPGFQKSFGGALVTKLSALQEK